MTGTTKRSPNKSESLTNKSKPSSEKTSQAAPKDTKGEKSKQGDKEQVNSSVPALKPGAKPNTTKSAPVPKTPPVVQQASTPPRQAGSGVASTNPPAFPPPRPPSGLFGSARPNARVTWEILPSNDAVVRVDVTTVSVELFNLIGIEAPPKAKLAKDTALATHWAGASAGVPTAVAQIISDFFDVNSDAEASLKEKLDTAWSALGFKGAALLHNWREEAKVAFATRLQAIKRPAIALRATNPILILNILSRARSSTLIANMPVALERPFLERQVFTDDPRIVEWVRSSGCIEQALVDPSSSDDAGATEE